MIGANRGWGHFWPGIKGLTSVARPRIKSQRRIDWLSIQGQLSIHRASIQVSPATRTGLTASFDDAATATSSSRADDAAGAREPSRANGAASPREATAGDDTAGSTCVTRSSAPLVAGTASAYGHIRARVCAVYFSSDRRSPSSPRDTCDSQAGAVHLAGERAQKCDCQREPSCCRAHCAPAINNCRCQMGYASPSFAASPATGDTRSIGILMPEA